MPHQVFSRPSSGEYAPYYETYIRLIPDGDILALLESQLRETLQLLEELHPSQGAFAYAEGKWTVKEVIGHIIV